MFRRGVFHDASNYFLLREPCCCLAHKGFRLRRCLRLLPQPTPHREHFFLDFFVSPPSFMSCCGISGVFILCPQFPRQKHESSVKSFDSLGFPLNFVWWIFFLHPTVPAQACLIPGSRNNDVLSSQFSNFTAPNFAPAFSAPTYTQALPNFSASPFMSSGAFPTQFSAPTYTASPAFSGFAAPSMGSFATPSYTGIQSIAGHCSARTSFAAPVTSYAPAFQTSIVQTEKWAIIVNTGPFFWHSVYVQFIFP